MPEQAPEYETNIEELLNCMERWLTPSARG
jgi:hypothetical protein